MGLRRLLPYLLTLLALALPAPAGAVPPPATRVVEVSDQAGQPRSDGTFLVWPEPDTDAGGTTRRLYAMRLGDRVPALVAAGLPTRSSFDGVVVDPLIDAGYVVWLEGTDAQRAIRARNLVTGELQTIASGAVAFPALAGTLVSWWEDVDQERARRAPPLPATLKVRDLATMAAPRVVTQIPNTIYHFGPVKMSSGWVVWGKQSGTWNWDLYAVPLAGGSPQQLLSTFIGHDQGPNFDLNGDRVVVSTARGSRPADAAPGPVVELDLRTGARKEHGPHHNLAVAGDAFAADERYTFWSTTRSGPGPSTVFDLWGYDPRSDSAFIIAGGDQPGSLSKPLLDAGAGVLVWRWHDQTGMAIYAARIAELLPSARRPAPAGTSPEQIFVPETGHTLSAGFKASWEQRGGLPIFGHPLTEEFIERNADSQDGRTTQYFERQRFEWHAEHAGTPYEVLLGRLGVDLLQAQGRDWAQLPKASPAAPHYFPETGHAIAPQFWSYWRSHGLEFGDPGVSSREALALFGYPITEPGMETNSSGDTVLTQWFERARFEWHPSNPEPYKILLGRLGDEALKQRGW